MPRFRLPLGRSCDCCHAPLWKYQTCMACQESKISFSLSLLDLVFEVWNLEDYAYGVILTALPSGNTKPAWRYAMRFIVSFRNA